MGFAAVAVLCTVIAGANIPNPLAPVYVASYGLTALVQSALFSTYMAALVTTLLLLLLLRGKGRGPERILLLAVAASLLGDAALVAGSQSLPLLFVGRALSGIAVALATGAAATVALARLGERARTAVATSATLGSLVGNFGAGAIGVALPTPVVVVYLVHAAVLGIFTLPLVRHSSVAPAIARIVSSAPSPYRLRHRLAGFLLGGTAWAVAGVILALVPGALSRADPSLTLIQTVLPSSLFLLAAWIGQTVARRGITRLRAWQVLVPLLGGLALVGSALQRQDQIGIVVASVIAGLGQGPAYSLGLATVAHGLDARRQGTITSLYACIAYTCCGVVVLAAGAVGSATSVSWAVLAVALGFAVIAVTVIALAGPPQSRQQRCPAQGTPKHRR